MLARYAPLNSTDPTRGFPVVVYFPAGAFEWGAANDQESNAYHKSLTPGPCFPSSVL